MNGTFGIEPGRPVGATAIVSTFYQGLKPLATFGDPFGIDTAIVSTFYQGLKPLATFGDPFGIENDQPSIRRPPPATVLRPSGPEITPKPRFHALSM
jgi:hypothetical protein